MPQYLQNLSLHSILSERRAKGQQLHSSGESTTQIDHHLTTSVSPSKPVLFLDFDGTLAPIVAIPSDARMPNQTRALLSKLKSQYDIFIVSGRERSDVKKRVSVDGLGYAGSHGFEIEINGEIYEALQNKSIREDLDRMFGEITERLKNVKGCILEHNNWSLSVHYRCCESEDDVDLVKHTVTDIYSNSSHSQSYSQHLKISHGKKVLEIKPNVDWHKGKAVEHIMECYKKEKNIEYGEFLPVYIGDDRTDEDAFSQVQCVNGVGIIVADSDDKRIVEGETKAHYYVHNTDEVVTFLSSLLQESAEEEE